MPLKHQPAALRYQREDLHVVVRVFCVPFISEFDKGESYSINKANPRRVLIDQDRSEDPGREGVRAIQASFSVTRLKASRPRGMQL
jgi:hypothetical protein